MTTVTTSRRQGVNSSAAIKVPCACATTANITLSGEQTIDGVTTSSSRVLVKDQTTASENGIYDSSSSTWQRAPDWDGDGDIKKGTLIYVHSGTSNSGWWYVATSDTITVGTTSVTISQAGTSLAQISAYIQTLINDADAATALTTLTAAGLTTDNALSGAQTISGAVTMSGGFNSYKAISSSVVMGSGALTANQAGGINNIAIGTNALAANTTGDSNIAIGTGALDATTTQSDNIAIGVSSLTGSSNTGAGNVAIGTSTLAANTSGSYNITTGFQAGTAITTGSYNVAIGFQASVATNTGNYNTVIGSSAHSANTGGTSNTIIGQGAGSTGTGGSSNVAVGAGALNSAGTSTNTAVGAESLDLLSSGSQNTALGYQAGDGLWTGSNCTIIGYQADSSSTSASNEITLGNSSIATLRCQVTTITALSDERDKKDIHDIPLGIDFVMTLRPVRFTWNMRDGGKVDVPDCGFIAQELKQAQENVSAQDWLKLVYDENPEKLEASAGRLLPILVKAIQDQQAMIQELEQRITSLGG
jgi:trimeric autotransporter adhesin